MKEKKFYRNSLFKVNPLKFDDIIFTRSNREKPSSKVNETGSSNGNRNTRKSKDTKASIEDSKEDANKNSNSNLTKENSREVKGKTIDPLQPSSHLSNDEKKGEKHEGKILSSKSKLSVACVNLENEKQHSMERYHLSDDAYSFADSKYCIGTQMTFLSIPLNSRDMKKQSSEAPTYNFSSKRFDNPNPKRVHVIIMILWIIICLVTFNKINRLFK